MRRTSYSIPHGMVFKKYYCAKCGTKLEKKRTHRVVAPGDRDYYHYRRKLTFPSPDYDVYGYKFKCPQCSEEISFDEQCIIEKIQKLQGYQILSSFDIKTNYDACKKAYRRKSLLSSIIWPLISVLIIFAFLYYENPDRDRTDFIILGALILISYISSIVRQIKKHKDNP